MEVDWSYLTDEELDAIDPKIFECNSCGALFHPLRVTSPRTTWKVKSDKTLEPASFKIVTCECGENKAVPIIDNPMVYIKIIEELIPYHLLDSAWVEKYLLSK